MQAEVGEPGSESHAERERLLRTAIDLKALLTAAQDRYAAVRALLDASAATPAAEPQVGASISRLYSSCSLSSKGLCMMLMCALAYLE